MRWHHLRRISGLVTAVLAAIAGVALAWPAMGGVALLGLLLAGDGWLALRTHRQGISATAIADITFTGVGLVLIDVPPPAIGMVVAYFVLVLAVLGSSSHGWPIGLYAVVVGTVAGLVNSGGQDDIVVRSTVAGILAVAVFGIATLSLAREFAAARRRRNEDTGRQIEIAGAIAEASRVLVSEEEASALSSALSVVRSAMGVSAVFVERNIVDDQGRMCAEVVDRAVDGTVDHPTLDLRSRIPWSVMPGARAHLEGGAPFFYRIEEGRGTLADRGGEGGLASEVNVPIMREGVWLGVVGAADDERERSWRSDDLVLLRTIADLTAAFWQRLDSGRQRDSLIGNLDGRLRYEEGVAKASRALLGEASSGIADALMAIGAAARCDEVYVTSTTMGLDGEPVAAVVEVWAADGLEPALSPGDEVPYSSYPGARDDFGRGSLNEIRTVDRASLASAIEVGGRWSGSVALVVRDEARRWTERDRAFVRTIAEIMSAYYERAEIRTRLEASLSSKDQLIGSVSHELRTPLTAVLGLAEELKSAGDAFDEPSRAELLGMIAVESGEMVDLVEDLLVAARSDDGNLPVFPERVDLSLLAQSVVSNLQVPEGVEISIEDVASVAFGDPVRIRQIVRNLFTNAFRYGGPTIDTDFGADESTAWVEVHDDGPGIAAEDRDAVFEPYGRSAQGATVKASVGLGLTLSRRLARIMGGDLRYVDTGEGATFRLEVPLPEVTEG